MENLTHKEFKELEERAPQLGRNHILLDFYADWCGPCQPIKKMLGELENNYEGIDFYKVNTEDEGDFAVEFNIRSIPTIHIISGYSGRKGPEPLVGLHTKEELIEYLDNI